MIGQMAIAIALPGFNDLGRSGTPIFLLMDHGFSTAFLSLAKNEENLLNRSLNFLQNAPSNSVLFSSLFICVAVSMPLEGLSFVKT